MTEPEVRKTYKIYVNGAFARSESGRSYEVVDAGGEFLANAVRSSRKDVRDAVKAARSACGKWASITEYNRGQILYRVAEMLDERRDQFVELIERSGANEAGAEVDESVAECVWYAGLCDKLAQIAGNLNPVAGPYFNITVPEPTGVVGVVVPNEPSLLGFVRRVVPVLCGGNAVVTLASEPKPLPALVLSEVFATSDVPPGVVNILSGQRDELVPVIAAHGDVDALDVSGVERDLEEVERAAAVNVKTVVRNGETRSPYAVTAFMEYKTVWHPKGT